MHEAETPPTLTSDTQHELAEAALRAEAWFGEPFVHPDEEAGVALAPGTARRAALDDALGEMQAGLDEPSPRWKVNYGLMLGLERVLTQDPVRTASGTELRRHQVDALTGMLTELIAATQRAAEENGNGNGHAVEDGSGNGSGRRGRARRRSRRRLRRGLHRREGCSSRSSTAVTREHRAATGSGIRRRRGRRSPRQASWRRLVRSAS